MDRPNILIIMTDQFNGTLYPDGPADFLYAPNLKALAQRSVRFANTYTGSPLCAPARAAFMSGQLPSRTGVYDNAAEFRSDIPTYAHHLRRAGYETALSGKMHFVGPDQMHGFEERLTTDIYPADFGWTPDYRKQGERIDWWYHNLGSVTGAGVAEISNQMEYDDEVAFFANQKLYQYARVSTDADRRPWCLTVSFTHPHDPYVARRKYWDLYEDCPALEPEVGEIAFEDHDPHSKRLIKACDHESFDIKRSDVRRARQGYFANISFMDEKVGELIETLRVTRMLDNTIILFTSDHGDMLGERGLWFKMSFFDGSARVPLTIAGPGIEPRLVTAPVSTLDVNPTLADLAGIDIGEIMPWTDGESLVPLMKGVARTAPALIEYAAEGSQAPLVCIREGDWKFSHCELDPPMLFNLKDDPQEMRNLAADPANAALVATWMERVRARWNLDAFDADVRQSQARRWVVYEALRNGAYFPWDYQPLQKASERYMRNHMDLNILEESKRFPKGRMMITVYGRNTSVNVQAVLWCIAELGLEHERLDFGGAFGKTDTAEYRAINPNQLVPTIRDGDTVVWESAAIVRYLACKYGDEHFWPRDPGQRARLDMWAEWMKSTIYPDVISTLFIQLVRTPKATRNLAAVGAAQENLKKTLARLDARLGAGPWLNGGSFSFADIGCGVLLHRYCTLDIDRAELPNLKAYYERLMVRHAYAAHVGVSFEALRHPEA